MAQKRKVSRIIAVVLVVILGVAMFSFFSFLNPTHGVKKQPNEPNSLEDLINFDDQTVVLEDLEGAERDQEIQAIVGTDDYKNISHALGQKGYNFDVEQATVSVVSSTAFGGFSGTVMSVWSSNIGPNGTRAFIAAAIINTTTLCVGGITNLLPPDQIPGIDPYIIVNAMPYLYISLYWWVWAPIAKVHIWHYWWYDSHSHPNWYWGVYWWWRTDVDYYWITPGYGAWLPWWWWFWHWFYWRHWYWWSTYFPY
jgi:hypothetical protein